MKITQKINSMYDTERNDKNKCLLSNIVLYILVVIGHGGDTTIDRKISSWPFNPLSC